ncbi:MAG: type II secretion system F family protein [Acidobacteriota bacterium]
MAALILVVCAFALGVGLVMALYVGATKLPVLLMQRRLDSRVQELSQAPEEATTAEGLLLKVQHAGPMPALDRLLGETTKGSALGRWIDQSGVRASISGVLATAVCSGLAVGCVAGLLTHTPWVFLAGFAAGALLPFVVLRVKRTRRMRAFEEQFPEGLDLISRALKAGHAFATGLKMVADEMPEPVGPEFRKTFDEQNFGLPMKDALDNLTFRMPLLDVRFFATAVLIQRETGGNLSEILENLSHVVRERFKILRQVRVYTAHGRFTGYVLLALPAFLGIALSFINPDHMKTLFHDPLGRMLLTGALVMQSIGFVWIKHVIKIEV